MSPTGAAQVPEQLMTVLVADDEPLARRRLVRLLRAERGVRVVAECKGGVSAVEQIRALSPDLVFLDIEMPDLDGFGVIAEIGAPAMPSVVFVTAFDEYAIRAFSVRAMDYLLKPFDAERLSASIERARTRWVETQHQSYPGEERLRQLLSELLGGGRDATEGLRHAPRYHERVAVKTNGATRIIQIGEVDWFETDGNYIRLHVGKSSYLIRNTAARLQEELDPRYFARIHRRYIVNIDRVVGLEPWFGGDAVVVLRDGTKLRLSRNFRESFLARMLSDHSESGERKVTE
jgi:two-component system LytT family response regulator